MREKSQAGKDDLRLKKTQEVVEIRHTQWKHTRRMDGYGEAEKVTKR